MAEFDTVSSSTLSEIDPLLFTDSQTTTNASVSLTSTPIFGSRKRKRGCALSHIWSFARPARPDEAAKDKHNHKIWYCGQGKGKDCVFRGTATLRYVRSHLESQHRIELSTEPSEASARSARFSSIDHLFKKQKVKVDAEQERVLEGVLHRDRVLQALVHLVARRSLPQNIITWPEFHAFCATLNHAAPRMIGTSPGIIRRQMKRNFSLHRVTVQGLIARARSRIHLCTDTWTSPQGHRKEFQAVNAHFVDEYGCQQKALLALPELLRGHAGVQCAEQIFRVAKAFGFQHRLGSITSDNASAMTTMATQLEDLLRREEVEWSAATNRLRCLGHILNIAVQAFLFVRDKDALEYASQQCTQQPLDQALGEQAGGWCSMQPLLKVKELAIALRSTRHSNAFKAIAGRTIPMPNETRWNSWLTMIDAALALRPQVNIFVAENEELEHLRLLSDDWHAIEETFHFLQPFKEATKACEGDKATLDQMLVTFDIIIAHLEASLARHADNKALSAAVACSWYALDKYYRLTDDSPVYTAALLLHPSYRKHYLDVTWRREWIKPAVDNVRSWWSKEYAHLEVDECP